LKKKSVKKLGLCRYLSMIPMIKNIYFFCFAHTAVKEYQMVETKFHAVNLCTKLMRDNFHLYDG
jgi:hypothetical protein